MKRMSFSRVALSENFTPGDHDVVIGKGKKFFFHKGNVMLRNLATSMLDEYQLAKTKLDKSLIISEVAEHVRERGNFVKLDSRTKTWVVAEDLLCREKISAVLRDALHQRCRSNTCAFGKNVDCQMAEEKKQAVGSAMPVASHSDWLKTIITTSCDNGMDERSATAPSGEDLQENEEERQAAPVMSSAPASPVTSSSKPDIFSIFAIALANISEEGDPFEPKPFYEGPASA